MKVSEIIRVQHPYAYGRYLIRKEHLSIQNRTNPTVSYYFKVI